MEDQQIAEHLALSSCLLYLNLHTSECWQFRKRARDLLSTHDKREIHANILVAGLDFPIDCLTPSFWINIIISQLNWATVAQWWEHFPPTNVAQVWIPVSMPCWLRVLSLAMRGISLATTVSLSLLKSHHFQIPIWSGMHKQVSTSS